mgnify:CR=1 FL=1
MKKIYFALSVAALGLMMGSCVKNLDIPQKGVTAIENFYLTDDDAEQAMKDYQAEQERKRREKAALANRTLFNYDQEVTEAIDDELEPFEID